MAPGSRLGSLSPAPAPRLTTKRLLLREYRLRDFEAFAEHMADPVATVHMTTLPDRRSAWRAFTSGAGTWALTGAGWWAVELLATGETVGYVGAFFRETVLADLPDADVELGWTVYRRHWRRGYASEAAAAALGFAFDSLPCRRAIAHIVAENAASIGVSRSIGMAYDGVADFYGEPSNRYAVARRS